LQFLTSPKNSFRQNPWSSLNISFRPMGSFPPSGTRPWLP
jgi:hypothetical protein